MNKRPSIRKEVLRILSKQKAPIKTGEVVTQVMPVLSSLGISPTLHSNRVSTELWKLRKAGHVQRTDNGYVLTGVNKLPEKVEVKPEVKPSWYDELVKAKKRAEDLQVSNDELREKNYICNVVIKYLEQRVNVLTQRGNT